MSLLQMAPSMFAFYMSSSVDFTMEHNVMALRVLYGASVVIQVVVGVLVWMAIRGANNNTLVAGTGTNPSVTVTHFDSSELRKWFTGILTNTALITFIHLKWNAPLPLFLNFFFGLFKIWDWQMFRLHLLGETPDVWPELARPFPAPPSPFADLMKQFTGSGGDEQPHAQVQAGSSGSRVEVLEDDDSGNGGDKAKETKKTK